MHPTRSNGLIWDLSGHEQSLSLCWVHGHMVYLQGQTLQKPIRGEAFFSLFHRASPKGLAKGPSSQSRVVWSHLFAKFLIISLLLSGDIVVLMATTWQWKWRFSRFRPCLRASSAVTNTAQARWGSSQYRSHPECCIRQVPALNAWQS